MTTLYKHSSRPEWGAAQLVAEEGGKRTFVFTDGRSRTFPASHWNLMQPVGAGAAGDAVPAASSTPGTPDAKDLRALHLQTRLLGDPVTSEIHAKAIAEQPRAGTYANTGYQDRYYDTYGRTLAALAEDLVKGAPGRAVHERAMKYLTRELAKNLSRDDYSFVSLPEHAVWMKVFAGDVLGIGDPELALAGLYLLVPTVKQPAAVARRLALIAPASLRRS